MIQSFTIAIYSIANFMSESSSLEPYITRYDLDVCAGCLHPDHAGFFKTTKEFMAWYSKHGPLKDRTDAPIVAVLLYR